MRISDWSSDVCSSDLQALCRDMLRQRHEKGQIFFPHALFIKREYVTPPGGIDEIVRIFDALGNALGRKQRAFVVTLEKAGQRLARNMGINRHYSSALGSLKAMSSVAVTTSRWVRSKRSASRAITSTTRDRKSTRLNSSH